MYQLSQAFIDGDVAIVIPEEHFLEFIASCIEANIPESDDPYQVTYAQTRYKEGHGIFANVQFGEYLNLWRHTEVAIEDFDNTCGDCPIYSWEEAIEHGCIICTANLDMSDIMELL